VSSQERLLALSVNECLERDEPWRVVASVAWARAKMSNSEMWAKASELSETRGLGARRFALRQAVRAKWNEEPCLSKDWIIIASRIWTLATLQH